MSKNSTSIYWNRMLLYGVKQYFRAVIAAIACFIFLSTNTQAQTGEALHFDGGNDYVSLPFNLSGSYTKEAWINPFIIASYQNIIAGTNSQFYLNGSTLQASNLLTNVVVASPANSFTAGNWAHVAVTYDDATKQMLLYINAVQVASGTVTDPLVYNDTESRIGSTTTGALNFTGLMDEVRLWNVVRTGAEILTNLNCALSGDEPGLIAYYDFNQGVAGSPNPTQTTLISNSDNCLTTNGTLNNFSLTGGTSNFLLSTLTINPPCGGGFANIEITGNGNCIEAGNSTPGATWDTDFGVYMFPGIDRIFTVNNTGTADLNISGISITGTDAADYSVETAPPAIITAGNSGTFTIRFAGTGSGMRTATITVNNDDSDEGLYSFDVVGEAAAIVPVSLSYFNGYVDGSNIKLQWKTAMEQNNHGFEVLRSATVNGDWASIGFVQGTNAALGSTYAFADNSPLQGTNLYRLKQVDNDGAFVLSQILTFNFSANRQMVQIYPNPVRSILNISVPNDVLNTDVQIRSMNGSLIATKRIQSAITEIDCNSWAQGIYLLRFANGQVQKFVKQ